MIIQFNTVMMAWFIVKPVTILVTDVLVSPGEWFEHPGWYSPLSSAPWVHLSRVQVR